MMDYTFIFFSYFFIIYWNRLFHGRRFFEKNFFDIKKNSYVCIANTFGSNLETKF